MPPDAQPARERWTFTVELPAGVPNGGRFMARLLKHLRRVWGVKCAAILDAPPVAAALADNADPNRDGRRR